jgi:pilus assembly protein Flp/PilA
MLAILNFLTQDESAAAAVEYGLLLGLVALAALAAITRMGAAVHSVFELAGHHADIGR